MLEMGIVLELWVLSFGRVFEIVVRVLFILVFMENVKFVDYFYIIFLIMILDRYLFIEFFMDEYCENSVIYKYFLKFGRVDYIECCI